MSVHRHTAGWLVRWREHGGQRSRVFARKSDADAWDREIKRRRQLGPLAVEQLTARGATLGEWITERWSPEHGATLERSTRTRYAEVYERHITPCLDDVLIRELSVSRLRAWQAERVAAGVSAGTLRKTRTFLSSCATPRCPRRSPATRSRWCERRAPSTQTRWSRWPRRPSRLSASRSSPPRESRCPPARAADGRATPTSATATVNP